MMEAKLGRKPPLGLKLKLCVCRPNFAWPEQTDIWLRPTEMQLYQRAMILGNTGVLPKIG